uniref:Endoplasmic reticulum transmembrane protein n=1 Tax=Nothoprocta perdicaria TaxID=30464 RepID=A0A8C7EI07_NOTPE
MTFQWTAVATFLYGEIAAVLLLCLPFISPVRWQKFFMISLWSKLAFFWNKAFLTIIILLIVLFFDAVREVKKYSTVHMSEKVVNVNTSAYDHIQMKLFRSQRNLYISGFSLFLWLVLRRIVTLLTQLAKGMITQQALETQVNNTTEAAKKYLTENEKLQQATTELTAIKKQSEGLKREYDRLMKEHEQLQVGGSDKKKL